jgi:hypothetical protein
MPDIRRANASVVVITQGLIEAALGTDLATLRGTGPWILPMQARFVIGQDGVITFANVAVNYGQCSEPASILPVLRELGSVEKSRGE